MACSLFFNFTVRSEDVHWIGQGPGSMAVKGTRSRPGRRERVEDSVIHWLKGGFIKAGRSARIYGSPSRIFLQCRFLPECARGYNLPPGLLRHLRYCAQRRCYPSEWYCKHLCNDFCSSLAPWLGAICSAAQL